MIGVRQAEQFISLQQNPGRQGGEVAAEHKSTVSPGESTSRGADAGRPGLRPNRSSGAAPDSVSAPANGSESPE